MPAQFHGQREERYSSPQTGKVPTFATSVREPETNQKQMLRLVTAHLLPTRGLGQSGVIRGNLQEQVASTDTGKQSERSRKNGKELTNPLELAFQLSVVSSKGQRLKGAMWQVV